MNSAPIRYYVHKHAVKLRCFEVREYCPLYASLKTNTPGKLISTHKTKREAFLAIPVACS